MTVSPFDSPAWRGALHDPDLSPLFSDTATLRAELLVMGTLALTQANAGTIPEVSAHAIQRAAMEVQIDPAALSTMTGTTFNPTLALVAQFKAEMKAPEHAQWVHHASNARLTAATGLNLRLRQCFRILGQRLETDATPPVAAYHSDAATRAGLAAGLGLSVDGDDPRAGFEQAAHWLAEHAARTQSTTALAASLRHQIAHLNAALQSADDGFADITTLMTLPQMVVGLGKLLNRSV